MPVSQFTPSPSPAVSTCLLSVSVSHCCPAHRFISTIFLDSIYMHSVQSLSHVRLFVTPWTAARQASLPITNSKNLFKLMSIESVMPSNISSSVSHFSSCHQSFQASETFPMSSFLHQVAKVFVTMIPPFKSALIVEKLHLSLPWWLRG